MRAPIAGDVVQKLVCPGQVIQAGTTTAFVISNVSTVWVQAHVYEKDLRWSQVGDRRKCEARRSPTFPRHVTYVGNMLDPATRTTPVRIVTQNPHGLPQEGSTSSTSTIHDKANHEALVVPTSAVLYDDENLPFVYVEAGRAIRAAAGHARRASRTA